MSITRSSVSSPFSLGTDLSLNLPEWAPLPLRLVVGIGLMVHGGIKLFAEGGHENIVHLIAQLDVPFSNLMGWVVGVVEFGGGLGILLGALLPIAAGVNALNVAGLIVLAWLAGGIPQPLPGGDPLPEVREAFGILAATVSLLLSGPGKLALTRQRLGRLLIR